MLNEKFRDLENLLGRHGPFTSPGFESGTYSDSFLPQAKILIVGAGGLGCELLKNACLSGFQDIHIIDMDTIDISNLNRQFLFRQEDVGKSKAVVAKERVGQIMPHVNITAHFCKIQDYDDSFYSQFNLIISGLDSISARRWLNGLLCQMVTCDEQGNIDQSTVIPLIDGGTEGWKGQSRVILPKITSCFECSLDMFPPATVYPLCTIANTPRLPEHCIEYALAIEWPKNFPEVKLDGGNQEHIQWVFERATTRANEFGIKGVNVRLTQGVVKHIIPAIASTNAIVAAACTLEAFKLVTRTSNFLNNYYMFNGLDGIYTHTFEFEKKEDCPVCGSSAITISVRHSILVKEFIQNLAEHSLIQVKNPSLRSASKTIYMRSPAALEAATRANLENALNLYVKDSEVINVSDSALPFVLSVKIYFK